MIYACGEYFGSAGQLVGYNLVVIISMKNGYVKLVLAQDARGD